jgi:hypothetical protein
MKSRTDLLPAVHGLGQPQTKPTQTTTLKPITDVAIPVSGPDQERVVNQPPGNGGTATPANSETDSCDQARSMHKVTSGAFLNGLTMDDYYPNMSGKGYYEHPGSAGPFDTGKRAGANIQLYGVIPSPCQPDAFRLAQTVTFVRDRVNGTTDPDEGTSIDDIAASHLNVSVAPARQEFLGGGGAPLGYIISMADPPSVTYDSSANIELDRDFVTSLVGPGGTKSVSWSLSTRISKGAITKNELT